MILVIVLANLPVSRAQTFTRPDRSENKSFKPVQISSYKQDPFVFESIVERMSLSKFAESDDGRLTLMANPVWVQDEAVIYRENRETGEFTPFAWNPWPETRSNESGNFSFSDEERFPLFNPVRGPDGKIVLQDGLQLWTPNNLNLGMTTPFEAASAVKDAAEAWAGRNIAWGQQTGELRINAHSIIDFNGFYAPGARQVFLGIVPYRLPGETEVKLFETSTSWEMVGHECGHAAHHTIKPNSDVSNQEWRIWSESFADQMAMWASLRNRDRVHKLLAETNGDLNQSNSLTRLVEAFAAVVGEGNALRDAFHDKKVSDTSEEIHDRSEVLTGAAYKLFLTVCYRLKKEQRMQWPEALRKAGEIMGTFLMRAADYTPENAVTLEDVAKAYLKIDKEFFDSYYHSALADEFIKRELLDAESLNEWFAHESAIPYLCISRRPSSEEIEALIQANLDNLGIGQDFGLRLQSVVRDDRFGRTAGFGQTIVRVQLTLGRGSGATPLDNHGILVFRANGTLADYHAPLPPSPSSQSQPQIRLAQPGQLRSLILHAKQFGLDQHGAPLSIVRKPDGKLALETRVLRGQGLNAYLEVFTTDKPRGERREITISPIPPNKRISIPDSILN